jgi:uncharacterized membrane protein
MESHAKLFGHPIHTMLIVFPLGLLATAVIFDIAYFITGNQELSIFAFWGIGAGIVGGLLAAVFGAWDWMHIPADTRAKRIGAMHGGGNVVVVVLFLVSWLMRMSSDGYEPGALGYVLSFAGLALALFTGWLGGEMVDRLAVGVDPGAHLDAPSSLSGKPAGDTAH